MAMPGVRLSADRDAASLAAFVLPDLTGVVIRDRYEACDRLRLWARRPSTNAAMALDDANAALREVECHGTGWNALMLRSRKRRQHIGGFS